MKLLLLVLAGMLLFLPSRALATDNPLTRPNNKVGIHILFPTELADAAKLVNNKGDWGYVIIPIQSNDKDIKKWQTFLNEAGRLHLIPILRLATEGDYFNTSVWRKPTEVDVLDFANFLSSLTWPIKNRYIIPFNEVNRGDEWGGAADPKDYATILSYAVTAFKSRNQDFFIIGGGFDNAAPNNGTLYKDQYSFMREMNAAVPGIFNQIDGFASHSYPNPGFSQPPDVHTSKSITSFRFERDLIDALSDKDLPIFITETGWSGDEVTDEKRAEYYNTAFESVWNDPDVVAVMPFLFRASGQFEKFSFLTSTGGTTKQYETLRNIAKVKGSPTLPKVLGVTAEPTQKIVRKSFPKKDIQEDKKSFNQVLVSIYEWINHL